MSNSRQSSQKSSTRRKAGGSPFNLMIAGHASTGKSLFLRTLYESLDVKKLHFSVDTDPSSKTRPSPFIDGDVQAATPMPARIEFEEDVSSQRILLRLIDTPGLPIPVNIHKSPDRDYSALANVWADEIIKYLEAQYEATLLEESKVKRNPKSPDFQTHAMLYFIDPNVAIANKGLTAVDRLAIEKISSRVNIIPVLAKADLLSVRDLEKCRSYVMEDIKRSELKIFDFIGEDEEEDEVDEETKAANEELQALLPFSVINSEVQPDGTVGIPVPGATEEDEMELVLAREYPWGLVETENPAHCDFVRLKQILFCTHCDELKSITREVHYEQWRTQKLLEVRGSVIGKAGNLESVGTLARAALESLNRSTNAAESLGRASVKSEDGVKKRSTPAIMEE
ncbi:hypothetical protein HK098_008084 [Nowakowskiella sp. JEL0407]|nr:hypothetical protein HK098_008070 [Nowakowskiella sp. JEL0407]KAJ3129850.1 hypothetical protein HK098_008084 [Nowakowskiella sp. JEL0407]